MKAKQVLKHYGAYRAYKGLDELALMCELVLVLRDGSNHVYDL